MQIEERLKFCTMVAVVWFIAVFIVLIAHKWSIEGLHKRLKAIESRPTIFDGISKEVTQ